MQTAARHYLLLVGIAVAGLELILRAGSHLPAPAAPLHVHGHIDWLICLVIIAFAERISPARCINEYSRFDGTHRPESRI